MADAYVSVVTVSPTPLDGTYCNALLLASLNHVSSVQFSFVALCALYVRVIAHIKRSSVDPSSVLGRGRGNVSIENETPWKGRSDVSPSPGLLKGLGVVLSFPYQSGRSLAENKFGASF